VVEKGGGKRRNSRRASSGGKLRSQREKKKGGKEEKRLYLDGGAGRRLRKRGVYLSEKKGYDPYEGRVTVKKRPLLIPRGRKKKRTHYLPVDQRRTGGFSGRKRKK